jgi:hypothetical protein
MYLLTHCNITVLNVQCCTWFLTLRHDTTSPSSLFAKSKRSALIACKHSSTLTRWISHDLRR